MKRWEILQDGKIKDSEKLINILLSNRGLTKKVDKDEFLDPTDPMKISLGSLGIKDGEIALAIKRIKKAKKDGEHVIIYGDYDADGITGTATLWETLHELGIFVLPHIPERFSEGYGLNLESVKKLKEEDPKLSLLITVDHGITAGEKVKELSKMGIDMIITDHHQKGETLPKPLALIYTSKISGSALSWFFSREVAKALKLKDCEEKIEEKLLLAAIGTIADQLPLTGLNRSVVKFGLKQLNVTKRPGLLALFKEAGVTEIGPYEVGFMIAPRINSMGRLKHGLESLRLLCTKDGVKAGQISGNIARVNTERQKIVEEVVAHALSVSEKETPNVIVLSNEKYHEGVIGLAAARLAEKFYRPAIVLSIKGDIAKASARSISGFNIIEAIRKLQKYYIEGGGHPMAAGFSIKTENIDIFTKKINTLAKKILTDEVLQRKLKIDCLIDFDLINDKLLEDLSIFEPTGLGNPGPSFVTKGVELMDVRTVGKGAKHLKLKVKQGEHIFDSIFFGGGENYSNMSLGQKIDVVYGIEENIWNGNRSIQLKVKDVKLH
jgi:single-stranded-DNA-specific exonuclease